MSHPHFAPITDTGKEPKAQQSRTSSIPQQRSARPEGEHGEVPETRTGSGQCAPSGARLAATGIHLRALLTFSPELFYVLALSTRQ